MNGTKVMELRMVMVLNNLTLRVNQKLTLNIGKEETITQFGNQRMISLELRIKEKKIKIGILEKWTNIRFNHQKEHQVRLKQKRKMVKILVKEKN